MRRSRAENGLQPAPAPLYTKVMMQAYKGRAIRLAIAAATAWLMFPPAQADTPVPGNPGLRDDAPGDVNRPFAQELSSSAAPDLFLAIAGSVAVSSPLSQLPEWDPQVVAILNGAAFPGKTTVAVADLQSTLVDPASFLGFPYPWESRPVYRAPRGVAAALKERGLSMLGRANSHSLDWGIEGMRATGAALDEQALSHAGTGEREGLARMAAYLDEPGGKGRIALLSTATTYRPTSNALSFWGAAVGRPGISALEVDSTRIVPPQQRAELQRIACRFQYPKDTQRCGQLPDSAAVSLFGSRFATATSAATRDYSSTFAMNSAQLASELHFVREAKQNSDLCGPCGLGHSAGTAGRECGAACADAGAAGPCRDRSRC